MIIDLTPRSAIFLCREYGKGRWLGVQKFPRNVTIYLWWFSIGATWGK